MSTAQRDTQADTEKENPVIYHHSCSSLLFHVFGVCVCRYEACCPNLKRPSESLVTKARSSPSMATLLTPCRLTHAEVCMCLPLGECFKLMLLCGQYGCAAHNKTARQGSFKEECRLCLCINWTEVCAHVQHVDMFSAYVHACVCVCTLYTSVLSL